MDEMFSALVDEESHAELVKELWRPLPPSRRKRCINVLWCVFKVLACVLILGPAVYVITMCVWYYNGVLTIPAITMSPNASIGVFDDASSGEPLLSCVDC